MFTLRLSKTFLKLKLEV